MTEKDCDYCKIFVTGISHDELQALVANEFDIAFELRTLQFEGYSVDIEKNVTVTIGGIDNFLQWPVFLEFFGEGGASEGVAVEVVARILNSLWASNVEAVASCDFEDELPCNGGFSRPS
ncbi:hypothetical protein [Streptomonospora litoralis]|uniref:Uncharacterized protein n=1 Tax=Streptomonospora litoralis TaxID=2498135 RepID=A0A4P6Q0L4_9ACTN|nr:hypothetical protein [Streptomonospora litoralis]QBI52234.1 hypothetical protein EKD16_02090 [Streptomonospora litoralis]